MVKFAIIWTYKGSDSKDLELCAEGDLLWLSPNIGVYDYPLT